MQHLFPVLVLLSGLLLAGTALAAAPTETVSTAKDQRSVSLTIYNRNLALVKDRRTVTLPAGESRLAFREVSAQIRPETALLSGGLEILEQNFEYDLLSPESLLQKYVGREVSLVRQNPESGADLPPQQALVLAAGQGTVLQVEGRIETGIPGRLVFPDVPATLRDRPTLTMLVKSEQAGPQDMELSYLSGGLSWKADYVAELAADENSLDLNGWVTLSNESGVSYQQARLQLVAGKVNTVSRNLYDEAEGRVMTRLAAAKAGPPMQEESLFEYHLYTLDRPTTVLENQQKQVALLQAAGVQAVKEFIVRGRDYAYQAALDQEDTKLDVAVELEIKNEKERGLGLPLPAGVVRVYKKDSRGLLQFVGEDRISHTPEKEVLRLHLGTAFDVTAKKAQTAFKKLSSNARGDELYESSYELRLKNAKSVPVQVQVRESVPGDWEITTESLKHEKASAHEARWLVEVPAKGESVLSYTARVRL